MAEETTDKTILWTSSKKVLLRRAGTMNGILSWRDWRNATTWRRAAQTVLVLLNIYLCAAFCFWVRHFETGATGAPPMRPEGVEAWLPIAGLMNLKYALVTWEMPQTHTAAMILLAEFLLIALLLKKSFCSWLCPIGTLSEALWRLGKRIFKQNVDPPCWFDVPLRGLKYALMTIFLYVIITMPAKAIEAFMATPYGIIADVKMLNFFRFISATALITIIVLMALSVAIPNFWCRYLCPYGALLGLLSLLSPFKVRRDADACINCGRCAKVCPARLSMDCKPCIRSAECTACLSCIEVCPAQDALQFSLPPKRIAAVNGDDDKIARRWRRRKISGAAIAIVLLSIIGGSIAAARLSGYWHSQVPEWVYQELIPRAQMLRHP